MSSPGVVEKKRVDVRHEMLAMEIAENLKRSKPLTIEEMMVKVGYSSTTAKFQGRRALQSASMREVMEANGLTRDTISKVIQDATQAKVVAVYKGDAVETDAPDHKIRLAAASLMGDFTGDKKTVIETRNLNISVDKDVLLAAMGVVSSEKGEG